MNKFLLIDGNNVMFRAYFATAAMGNLMRNKNGFPTNMLYGFLNIYNKAISNGYTHVAIAFDKGSKTRRHQIYADYKAGRAETPKELIDQIPYLHRILDGLNVKYFMDYDFEADDIIASLSKTFDKDFDEIDVLSNDNDLFQLIDEKHFQLYSKQKETIKYGITTLQTEKGIYPKQIPDYKALIGDKSDNLKGVDGIGPVSAARLLNDFKTLDGIYENLDKLKEKEREKLLKDKESAYFTLDLATLNPTFDSHCSLDDFKIQEPNVKALKEVYMELDFNSFLKKLPEEKLEVEFESKVVDSFDDSLIDKDGENFLYLEVLGENYHFSSPVGFGLSNVFGNFYISFDDALSSFDFLAFLSDESISKVLYDYKKTYVVLKKNGIELLGVKNDILLSSYLIDPDLGKMNLSSLSSHFGYLGLDEDESIFGKKGKEMLPFVDIYAPHIAKKAFVLKIINPKELDMIKEYNQEYLLNDIEIPFSRVLGDMELLGLRVDVNALNKYEENILSELKVLENDIYRIVGHEFNILSPKQLGVVLFEELGLEAGKKTKTGYSTDADTLNYLSRFHPIVDYILRYRTLSKLEGTYVLGVKSAIEESKDSHIHSIYKQALTDTGRLSSTEPNLQNLPIRNKESSEFRKVFIPEDNSVLISSDYSQIELRVMAHMSNEENLISAFKDNKDIHEQTAKAILKKSEVTKEERSRAKAVNFGIIYGISAWGLSNDIGISPKEAQAFIDSYHEAFPRIESFSNSLIKFAEDNGYVETIFKRRRYIRDIKASAYNLREFAKRTAMNAPIQGTAADILKKAMVDLDIAIKKNMLHSKMVLTIHDEIVLNTPKEEIEKTLKVVKEVMENTIKLNVPLLVEANYGDTLYEAK